MAVSRQRSAVGSQWISRQRSAISGQPSAVSKEGFLLIKNLLLLTAESQKPIAILLIADSYS